MKDDPRVFLSEDAYLERYTISDAEIAAAATLHERLTESARQEAATERADLTELCRRAEAAQPAPSAKAKTSTLAPAPAEFKRGMHGYATIYCMLKRSPSTARQVDERFGKMRSRTRSLIRLMHEQGLVHICGWRPSTEGNLAAVWRAGAGVDVPAPGRVLPKRRSGTVRVELVAFAHLMRALAEPISAKALMEAVGVTENPMYTLLKHMKELRLIRIVEWDLTIGTTPVALYQLGSGRDADRPQATPMRELWRRENERRRTRNQMQALIRRTVAPLTDAVTT